MPSGMLIGQERTTRKYLQSQFHSYLGGVSSDEEAEQAELALYPTVLLMRLQSSKRIQHKFAAGGCCCTWGSRTSGCLEARGSCWSLPQGCSQHWEITGQVLIKRAQREREREASFSWVVLWHSEHLVMPAGSQAKGERSQREQGTESSAKGLSNRASP